MEAVDFIAPSGLLLMFALGLRHGLDPDHIACIDGLTWRALGAQRRHGHAPWVGTLFAVGHGLLVTSIAVGVSQLAHRVGVGAGIRVPEALVTLFGWVPTVLLVYVGLLNLRLLVRPAGAGYAPAGWKLRLLPRRLREHSSPWAVVLTGVLFATVFDTATQASAWGYVASHEGAGVQAALAAGLVFTAGMVITDTLDGRLVCRLGRRRDGAALGQRYRRALGWLIVGISFGVALYNVAKALVPSLELDERAFSLTGLSLMLLMLAIWGASALRARSGRSA